LGIKTSEVSAMALELSVVSVAPAARPSLGGVGRALPSLATLNGIVKTVRVPRSIARALRAIRAFNAEAVHGELLIFDKRDVAELEFLSHLHRIIMLPDGICGGCAWSNGSGSGKMPPGYRKSEPTTAPRVG
jgi:hypothetical protein